jgi:phosphonate metabolism protein PhnN/1,5-bisphosphokinase (PRPP-forming)
MLMPLSKSTPKTGRLVLVVGPSGVGKDTLIDGAKSRTGPDVVFPRREITRPAESGGEDHIAVTEIDFDRRESQGAYALSWKAHGLGYGIPAAIKEMLTQGKTVVANVSRSVLDEARTRFPCLVIVSVRAAPDILRSRLVARGREIAEDIEARVERAMAFEIFGPDVVELWNDGSPEDAVESFLGILTTT